MSDIVISVEHLSKRYQLGVISHKTLTHDLQSWWAHKRGREDPNSRIHNFATGRNEVFNEILALNDVSFEVRQGEVLGIIGRNGAGKSTLLKILSRVTAPTTGQIKMNGSIASLLEVGTGFHPELTGRENTYLNGSIMGMTRKDIDTKFDEIVDFAEIESFIDTPVKRYSSGMYVRLAFAVAAHLNPDILVLDEVLAVGDAAFQKKCLGKMGEVANEGRTVLFVSHNMAAIGRLCSSVIWIDQGRLAGARGDARPVISAYLSSAESAIGHREWVTPDTAPGDEYVRLVSVDILDRSNSSNPLLFQNEAFFISIKYRVYKLMMNAHIGFRINTDDGVTVFESVDGDNPDWNAQGRRAGVYIARCCVPPDLLNEGIYYLTIFGGIPFFKMSIMTQDVLKFEITPANGDGFQKSASGVRRAGVIAPYLEWEIDYVG